MTIKISSQTLALLASFYNVTSLAGYASLENISTSSSLGPDMEEQEISIVILAT